jgi:antitoxin (DNA-binding transcriptional repressor) of toxin-antitoxin stability system
VKTITIRQLCHHWPAAEAALKVEDEILITRDSKPVAKLVRIQERKGPRRRFDAEEHRRWLKKVWGNREVTLVDKYLASDREDRNFR